jgi:hypothetical protein
VACVAASSDATSEPSSATRRTFIRKPPT